MRNFPLPNQGQEQVWTKAFWVVHARTKYPKRKDKTAPLAPLKSFVVDRSATNVENSVYPPPNKQNKTRTPHCFLLAPPRTKGFHARKTTFVRITTQRTTQTRTGTRCQSRRHLDLIFLYFLHPPPPPRPHFYRLWAIVTYNGNNRVT